jgi:hypothetical protein
LFPDVKSNRAKRQEISSEHQKVAELSKTIENAEGLTYENESRGRDGTLIGVESWRSSSPR